MLATPVVVVSSAPLWFIPFLPKRSVIQSRKDDATLNQGDGTLCPPNRPGGQLR
jgi:hypothetical protein